MAGVSGHQRPCPLIGRLACTKVAGERSVHHLSVGISQRAAQRAGCSGKQAGDACEANGTSSLARKLVISALSVRSIGWNFI